MTDILDLAAEREEEHRADALAAQSRRATRAGRDSARNCRVCDEPIPPARREALPGVQTCVDCQIDLERAVR